MPADSRPACAVWVDYAGLRSGRATTQALMHSLAAEGLVAHRETLILGGTAAYRHSAAEWQHLTAAMGKQCESSAATQRPLLVAIQVVETDAQSFWSQWLPAIRKLRQRQRACCRVVLTTRIREPVSFYLSSYLWATTYKVRYGTQLSRPRTIEVKGRAHAVLPRLSFFEWCGRAKNLQSRVLLHGGASNFISDEQTGKVTNSGIPMTSAGLDVLMRTLQSDFDVVTPLEAFDDGVRDVVAQLGIPRNASTLRYERVSPRFQFYGGGPVGATAASAVADICPNMSACIAHVHAVAPLDVELYRRFGHAQTAVSSTHRNETRPPISTSPPVLASGMSPRCASAAGAWPANAPSMRARLCPTIPSMLAMPAPLASSRHGRRRSAAGRSAAGTSAASKSAPASAPSVWRSGMPEKAAGQPTDLEVQVGAFTAACTPHSVTVDFQGCHECHSVTQIQDVMNGSVAVDNPAGARPRELPTDKMSLGECLGALRTEGRLDLASYRRPTDDACDEVLPASHCTSTLHHPRPRPLLRSPTYLFRWYHAALGGRTALIGAILHSGLPRS